MTTSSRGLVVLVSVTLAASGAGCSSRPARERHDAGAAAPDAGHDQGSPGGAGWERLPPEPSAPADAWPGLSPVCEEPGGGPPSARPSWSDGRFPLAPILELYAEAQCQTLSPAFLHRLVADLPEYLAASGSITVEAGPDELGAAVLELLESQVGLAVVPAALRQALGIEPAEDLDDGLARVIRLYLRQGRSPDDADAWEAWLQEVGWLPGGYLGDIVVGLFIAWGAEALADALAVDEAELAESLASLIDTLYRTTLGQERQGITEEDELGAFLSLVHVGPAERGSRAAYVFVVGPELAPVRGLRGADFDIAEEGEAVAPEDVTVTTLRELAEGEDAAAEFSLSLVLDYSGSMRERDKRFLEEGLYWFLEVLPPVLRAGVVKFSESAVVYQPMSDDIEAVKDAISRPMSPGSTALYDAMRLGIDELAVEPTTFRLQVAFTDGRENSSEHDCHLSVVERSREAGVPVFVVGMGQINVPAMFTLTNETHACFLYAPSSQEIRELYELIGGFLADTYVLRWPARSEARAARVSVVARTPFGLLDDESVPQRAAAGGPE